MNPNGDIQQSPFTDKVFGNIETKSLLSIISNQTFQEYWDIPKDKIEVCKDCEFRYVCNDGRMPLKRDDKMYYFEEICTYNPYKN
ncbi:SPASM domain-containing protein [Aquimarina megaterium]|uniref:SPASM domain-containing protein n=1 Tax=Aquimarina megaterium TaxID=1443666 RepID=UPI0009DFBF27